MPSGNSAAASSPAAGRSRTVRTSLATPSSQAAGTSKLPTGSTSGRRKVTVNRVRPARAGRRSSSQRPAPSERGGAASAAATGSSSGSACTTTERMISRSPPTSKLAVTRHASASQSMSLKLTAVRISETRRSRAIVGRTSRTRPDPATSKPPGASADPAARSHGPPRVPRSHCQPATASAVARSTPSARRIARGAGGSQSERYSTACCRETAGRHRNSTRCRPAAIANSLTSPGSSPADTATPG